MAKKTKKDNEEVVAQPAVASTQNPYQNDPEVKQDASGDMIFTANPRMTDEGDDDITFTGEGESDADTPSVIPTTTNKVEDDKEDYGDEQDLVLGGAKATPDTKVTTAQPKKGSLYDIEATAVSNAAGAKSRYDAAYDALKDEYKAMADLLKPKDRTEEQKRLRNVALAQAIGQGLAAIFGGIYANSKKGRGRIVLPEDFASKTLAKAEELREKGLLDEQNYKKLLGDLRLRTADLELKRSGEDYAAAQGEINRARQAIQEYERGVRQAQEKADERLWRSNENKLDRESRKDIATQKSTSSSTSTDSSKPGSGTTTAYEEYGAADKNMRKLISKFLPSETVRTTTSPDDLGNPQVSTTRTSINDWSDRQVKKAIIDARSYIKSVSDVIGVDNAKTLLDNDSLTYVQDMLDSNDLTWESIKPLFDAGWSFEAVIDYLKKVPDNTPKTLPNNTPNE